MIKRAKIERTLLLFLCGLLSAGSFAIHGLMAGYNPVLKISNQRYDAQIVKPSKTSGYPIYYSGPYFTSSSSRTADSNSSNYSNDYVRVMQTKTTKTGTYAKLRLFNQTIGWMNIKGLKKATLTQVANATMKQNDVSGSALLASAGSKHTVIVNNGFANRTKKVGQYQQWLGRLSFSIAAKVHDGCNDSTVNQSWPTNTYDQVKQFLSSN